MCSTTKNTAKKARKNESQMINKTVKRWIKIIITTKLILLISLASFGVIVLIVVLVNRRKRKRKAQQKGELDSQTDNIYAQ